MTLCTCLADVLCCYGLCYLLQDTVPWTQLCTLLLATDYSGGDLKTSSGTDSVVATVSDAMCCNSCANTLGCTAWWGQGVTVGWPVDPWPLQ